MQQKSDMSLPR